MGKTWMYRLLGAGKLPHQLQEKLVAEWIVLLDEGIGGSITYQNFRAPGKASNWKRSNFTGAVVLTKVRFVGLAYTRPVINLPYDDPRLPAVQVTLPGAQTISLAFDAATFHDDWSGSIECRFDTEHAAHIQATLAGHQPV